MSNVTFATSGFAASTAGQITLSYGTASSTSLSSSTFGTSYQGQEVRFNAFVSPTDGGGTVSFASDGNAISGCSNLPFVAGGGTDWAVSCTTSDLSVGSHTITATYSGDSTYAASSTTFTQTVNQNTTSTSLTAGRSTTGVNIAVVFAAIVTSTDGGGTVAFTQGGAPLKGCEQVPLASSSKGYRAACKQSWSQPGSYTIAANYSGDTNYASSTGTTTITVSPLPSVSSISPKSGSVTGGQTVTIAGSNLTGTSQVWFGSTAATNVTVVSDSQVTATVPAHTAGTVNVWVVTPAGKSAVSSGDHYNYYAVPTVTSISPASGPRGTAVTVTGTGFASGAHVAFGANSATKVTLLSSTQIKAWAPAGTGSVDVTVTTPGGTSATSQADQFTYPAT